MPVHYAHSVRLSSLKQNSDHVSPPLKTGKDYLFFYKVKSKLFRLIEALLMNFPQLISFALLFVLFLFIYLILTQGHAY